MREGSGGKAGPRVGLSRREDDPDGGSNVGDSAECARPEAKAKSAACATALDKCTSVHRIGIHLKGSRLFVALASRLDTPTNPGAAASAAAAVRQATASEIARKLNTTRRAVGRGEGGDGTAEDDSRDEELQDQSPDAEVLPRSWDVTDGAYVYFKARRRSDTAGIAGGSPYSRRHDAGLFGKMEGRRGRGDRPLGRDPDPRRRRYSMGDASSLGRVGASFAGGVGVSPLESSQLHMRWRELTRQPCDLVFVIDTSPEKGVSRTLLSMPEYGVEEQERARHGGNKPGGIYISPSMAEYYLLLSIYFGERWERRGCSSRIV